MNVDLCSWRAVVGCFHLPKHVPATKSKFILLAHAFQYFLMCLLYIIKYILQEFKHYLCLSLYIACLIAWCGYFCIADRFLSLIFHLIRNHSSMFLYVHLWWTFLLILREGDVHPHPGQTRNLLKLMHWNLNSIIAHDGIRVPIIQSFNIVQNYDLIIPVDHWKPSNR